MELTPQEREIPASIEQHLSEEAPHLARLTDDRRAGLADPDPGLRHGRAHGGVRGAIRPAA
jgi:hypothetical protein